MSSSRIRVLAAGCALVLGSAAAADVPPAWLAGCWLGEAETSAALAFEVWSAPRAERMLGMSQTLRGGTSVFEYMRIDRGERGLRYVPQPGGRPPVEFLIERVEAQRIVFSNPQHDFPKYIDYQRKGDRLEVQLGATSPDQDGKRALYAFRRVACDTLFAAR